MREVYASFDFILSLSYYRGWYQSALSLGLLSSISHHLVLCVTPVGYSVLVSESLADLSLPY